MLVRVRLVLSILVLLVGLPAVTAPVQAQDLYAPSPFLTLFPELADLAAPAWVREGIRVSYYGGDATHYRGPDDPSPAGAGVLQTDVVAIDRRAVVLSSRFLLDTGDGAVQPSFTVGQSSPSGAGPF